MGAILGFDGSLTINSATVGFTNLRFGYSHSEVDTTTNLSEGKKTYAKGLFDQYIAGDIIIDDSTACATVLAAVNSREPVTVTATLGTGTNAITITGSMFVFGSDIAAGVDGTAGMTVTCRPAAAD